MGLNDMNCIIEVIESLENAILGKPVKESTIINDEKKLNLKFADDYRSYIKHYGCMAIDGHEITGISKIKNYDVITITECQKQYNKDIPSNWYVIEQLNIDGIVIWQSSTGEIYQTAPNKEPLKICDSLVEYINLWQMEKQT